MATTLFRIIKFGVQQFSRNVLLSATTVAVLAAALLVFHGLIIFGVVSGAAVASLQDKIDISVYFKNNIAEDNILKLSRALESLVEVKSVEYVSQGRALEIFKEKHQNDPTIAQALEELQANPLLASLNVKAKNPNQYSTIAQYLENANLSETIEKVSYAENKVAIERLAKIVDTMEGAGLAANIFFALVALLVTFNTVRLAIYSNREEISVMRLVGAPNRFINGPYIVAGAIYGVLAGVLSLLIASPLVLAVSPYVRAVIPELNLTAYFTGHLPQLIIYQLIGGILISSLSAVVAVRRYLKI